MIEFGGVNAHLVKVGAALDTLDVSEALEECKPHVAMGIAENFDTQSDPEGIPWPPRRDNKPHPLLQETGKMRAAATGGPGAIEEVAADSLTMGVSLQAVPYAGFQNDGTRNIPAREYMGVGEATEAECERIIGDYVQGIIEGGR